MTSINDLFKMKDADRLNEIMNETDDWLLQLDAAEALIKLGDRRGLDFLLIAAESDDDDISVSVAEMLESPDAIRLQEQIEAEEKIAHQKRLVAARLRLQNGKKVFLHKMVFIPSSDIMRDDPSGEGYLVPQLDEAGLEGWEVVNIIPRRRQLLVGSADDHFSGAFFLLKKEVMPDELSELE